MEIYYEDNLEGANLYIGRQIIENDKFFAALGIGVGKIQFKRMVNVIGIENGYLLITLGEIININAIGCPIEAKFYYKLFKHVCINAQMYYNINKVEPFAGAAVGLSFGLFHETSIKYLPPQINQ